MSQYELSMVAVTLGVWAVGVTVLYVKAELQNRELFEKIHELQEKRVEDVQFYADQPGGPPPAEVEDVGTPDTRAQEAVEELNERVAFQFLKRKAEAEGRTVSEKRLREDARKMVKRFGIDRGGSPNLG